MFINVALQSEEEGIEDEEEEEESKEKPKDEL